MNNLQIRYRFLLPDNSEESFQLEMHRETLELLGNTPATLPDWAKLEFHQCPNCPLNPAEHPYCPLAANLVNLANRFGNMISHDILHLEVTTNERRIVQVTSAQRGLASLIGVIFATCGCPRSSFLRPMARFHLPLASNEETVYRAVSMYLLAQYFIQRTGGTADIALKGLVENYRQMEEVNRTVAERLRSIAKGDSMVNAIIVLDVYAKTLEHVIDDTVSNLRPLFSGYTGA